MPTFEVGRKAGLGLPIDDANEPGLTLSWAAGATEFPVYYEWYFRTGDGGDFEDLVQRIVPREVDPRVGVRDMDIAAPGFGMPHVAEPLGPGVPPSHHEGVVGLEGALKAPTMTPKRLDAQSAFPAEAAVIVNVPAEAKASGNSDPVVAPPLVGGWHALLDRVDPGARPAWPHALNLDPRARAAGGLGARVARKHQERYMKLAWEQAGEILAANRKALHLRFAQAAAHKIFVKSVSPLPQASALGLTSPVHARVPGSPKTIRGLMSESRLPAASTTPAFRKFTRPRGPLARRALPAELRRGSPGRFAAAINDGRASAAPAPPPVSGPTLDRIADAVDAHYRSDDRLVRLSWPVIGFILALAALALVALGASGLLALGCAVAATFAAGAAGVFFAARGARARQEARSKLRLAALTPDALPGETPASFALSAPGATAAPASDPVAARDFGEALRDFSVLLAARPAAEPERPRFDESNAHAKVMAAIAPAAAYPRRAASLVRVGNRSIVEYVRETYVGGGAAPPPDAPPSIKPVMAYPDIKEPMYLPLSQINDELLAPNLGLIPPNTVTLMLTNPPFIEAYMAGVNHEFARELLWREYPTDCRGSPFRQFWDVVERSYAGPHGRRPRAPPQGHQAAARVGADFGARTERQSRCAVSRARASCWRCAATCSSAIPTPSSTPSARAGAASQGVRTSSCCYDEEGAKALAGVDDRNIEYPIFTALGRPRPHLRRLQAGARGGARRSRARRDGRSAREHRRRQARLVLRPPGGAGRAALRPRREGSARRHGERDQVGQSLLESRRHDRTGDRRPFCPVCQQPERRAACRAPRLGAERRRHGGRHRRHPLPEAGHGRLARAPDARARKGMKPWPSCARPGSTWPLSAPRTTRRRQKRGRFLCSAEAARAAAPRSIAPCTDLTTPASGAAALDREIAAPRGRGRQAPHRTRRRDPARRRLRRRASADAHRRAHGRTRRPRPVSAVPCAARDQVRPWSGGHAPAGAHLPRRHQRLDPRSAPERRRARVRRRLLGGASARSRTRRGGAAQRGGRRLDAPGRALRRPARALYRAQDQARALATLGRA